MFQILKVWSDEYNEPTGEQAVWYQRILDHIKRIEVGEESIDGKRAEAALIWCIVNFISAWARSWWMVISGLCKSM